MNNLSFHESTVIDLRFFEKEFHLKLTDVSNGNTKIAVFLKVSNVSKTLIDSQSSEIIDMPTDDGEILNLSISGATLSAIIEWNDFQNKKSFTHSYEITGEEIKIEMMQ